MIESGGAMAQRPKRETVNLSAYPDLVVIYLGMRVNALTGFKTLLGFGPRISQAVNAKPMVSCCTKTYCIRCGISGCANIGAISILWKRGRAPSRIAFGGNSSCAIAAAQDFGTRHISVEAGLKRSTWTCRHARDSRLLHQWR
jgi:hypothetical protein